ncbi:hypothetical protein HanIR_Chr06g0294641 [Helianthus annuus]|nr:hypothetical protein HanIR_Chr06g0294641 [Helianthus annuus]
MTFEFFNQTIQRDLIKLNIILQNNHKCFPIINMRQRLNQFINNLIFVFVDSKPLQLDLQMIESFYHLSNSYALHAPEKIKLFFQQIDFVFLDVYTAFSFKASHIDLDVSPCCSRNKISSLTDF